MVKITEIIDQSWGKIAPFWPLKNLVAVNPLQGFEDMPIEKAYIQASAYFQQKSLPGMMHRVNRETIKWAQLFFDQGQAVIAMPYRSQGFYKAWKKCSTYENKYNADQKKWIRILPESAEGMIEQTLLDLHIADQDKVEFLTLLLTTLPGWAAHVRYCADWSPKKDPKILGHYLAVRLAHFYLGGGKAEKLIEWYQDGYKKAQNHLSPWKKIEETESAYQALLLEKLSVQKKDLKEAFAAQFVFCIDVRSEALRRALEKIGNYQTIGCAGFFGLPLSFEDGVTKESYSSCPVFVKPKQTVKKWGFFYNQNDHGVGYSFIQKPVAQIIQAGVGWLGKATGLWMLTRAFMPVIANSIKKELIHAVSYKSWMKFAADAIPFSEQCIYAENALRMMSLLKNFAPVVVLCGHGATVCNNTYATLFDCGSCGGHHGGNNAFILATILNRAEIREYLFSKNIVIPSSTYFIAAEHRTTTDQIEWYDFLKGDDRLKEKIEQLKKDAEKAGKQVSVDRSQALGFKGTENACVEYRKMVSVDWSQTRPEWALARNASFIIAPRYLTKNIDCEGRAFLHSYDYQEDLEGKILATILSGPLRVAKWINTQYLFSALDSVAYGSGSMVTQNIVSKIGVMQGMGSDLMHGLPLQMMFKDDGTLYYDLQRLTVIIYAPRDFIMRVLQKEIVIQKLFMNGWMHCVCIETNSSTFFILSSEGVWKSLK